MSGRDDGKVAGATIMTRRGDRDDVIGGQAHSVDIHDPAAPSDAAIVVEDREQATRWSQHSGDSCPRRAQC